MDPRRYLVYTLSHPETGEVRYVGKTVSGLSARLRRHLAEAKRKPKRHACNWINSLPSKPLIEELEEVDSEEKLIESEVFYISYFKWLGFRLVNGTDGGDGSVGFKHSQETKEKLSFLKKGKGGWKSPNKAAAMLGNKLGIGRTQTEEQKIAKSRANGGRPFVDQYGNRYETVRGAAKRLGIFRQGIVSVLKGRYRQYEGFIFKYVEGGM